MSMLFFVFPVWKHFYSVGVGWMESVLFAGYSRFLWEAEQGTIPYPRTIYIKEVLYRK